MDKETLELIERLEEINEESIDAIKSTQNSLSICQIILTAATVINVAIAFFTLPVASDALYGFVTMVALFTAMAIIFRL